MTQKKASTMLDLPQPLGPTMQVVPEPLKVTTVRSQNDLKPTISTFRSLSKMSPFCLNSLRVEPPFAGANEKRAYGRAQRQNAHRETTYYSSRGGSLEQQVDRFAVA